MICRDVYLLYLCSETTHVKQMCQPPDLKVQQSNSFHVWMQPSMPLLSQTTSPSANFLKFILAWAAQNIPWRGGQREVRIGGKSSLQQRLDSRGLLGPVLKLFKCESFALTNERVRTKSPGTISWHAQSFMGGQRQPSNVTPATDRLQIPTNHDHDGVLRTRRIRSDWRRRHALGQAGQITIPNIHTNSSIITDEVFGAWSPVEPR